MSVERKGPMHCRDHGGYGFKSDCAECKQQKGPESVWKVTLKGGQHISVRNENSMIQFPYLCSQRKEALANAESVCEFLNQSPKPDSAIRQVVDEQANDEGLWCETKYASEAYLQAALRRLHEVIEGKSAEECAIAVLANR